MTPWVWILSRIGRPSDTEDKQTLFGKILNLKNVNNQNFNTINNKIGEYTDDENDETLFGKISKASSGSGNKIILTKNAIDSNFETFFPDRTRNTNYQMPTSNLIFYKNKYYVFNNNHKLCVKNRIDNKNGSRNEWDEVSGTPSTLYAKNVGDKFLFIYNDIMHIICNKSSSGNIFLHYTQNGSSFQQQSNITLQTGTYSGYDRGQFKDCGDYFIIKESSQLSSTNKTVKYSLIKKSTMSVKNISFDYTASGVSAFDSSGYLTHIAIINSVTYVFLYTTEYIGSVNKLLILIYKDESKNIENPKFNFFKEFGEVPFYYSGTSMQTRYNSVSCFTTGNSVVINIRYGRDSGEACQAYIFNGYSIAAYGKYKNALFSINNKSTIQYGMGSYTYGEFTRDGLPYTIISTIDGSDYESSVAGCITTPGFSIFLPKDTVFISASHYERIHNQGIPYEKYDDTGKLKMKEDGVIIFPSVYDANGNVVTDCGLVTILN